MEFEQAAFVTLANSFAEVSLFVDPSTKIIRAYGPVYKFTGKDPIDIEGCQLFSLFTPECSKQLSILMKPLRARVQRNAGRDASVPLDDDGLLVKNLSLNCTGGPMLVEVKISPRRDSTIGGGAYYYMVVLTDISHTRDLERKKNSFFATMNHELRTPLNGIIGLAESLRSGEKDKGRMRHFDMMLNSAQCMLKLINNILDTATMKNSAASLDLSPVKINNLVEEVVEVMRSAVDKRGRKLKKDSVDISVELVDDLPAIDLDREKICQAIEALLNNGLKFTQKGHVIVRTCADPGGVLITVEDTGIGISPDSIERIFDSFEQEDNDHENRKFEGLGLGLTLAKEVVALHGGRLWVQSTVGAGSKFCISLPSNARALKLISEKQRARVASSGFTSNLTDGSVSAIPSATSQEERDRNELLRVQHTEQIEAINTDVRDAMQAIASLTGDLQLFESKFQADAPDSSNYSYGSMRTTSNQRRPSLGYHNSPPHFLASRVRSYEISAPNSSFAPPTNSNRRWGTGTHFEYDTYY